MKPDKVLSTLGLATKAGKTVSGELTTEKEVKARNASLVIIAADASENTKKKFQNMCNFYEVPFRLYSDRDNLGRSVGKEFRSTVALLDEGFAKGILKHLN